MTEQNIQSIKDAIKAQKWDKSSYVYAINGMLPYYWGDGEGRYKADVIAYFYQLVETRFSAIKGYTTFKHLSINNN